MDIIKNKKVIGLAFLLIIAALILIPLPFGESAAYAAGCEDTIFGIPKDLTGCAKEIVATIMASLLSLAGIILGIAGGILNLVMKFTVVDMKENLGSLLAPSGGIYTAWTTFRDLANIFFIFIILYIAIGTILRLSTVETKKLLVHVIIIALLLNFSLFFTKVIIDASNILAIAFHDAMSFSTGGISAAFMQPLGLGTTYSIPGATRLLTSQGWDGLFLISLLGTALFLITAFVFLVASLMFVMRYLVLIFLMILSPLAFLAMALPKDEYSKKWWGALFSQALFAPVFLALLWVALKMLQTFLAPTQGATYADLAATTAGGESPSIGALSLLMNFMMVIGTVFFALIVSRQISQSGAGSITQFGQKAIGNWTRKRVGDLGGATARSILRGGETPGRWMRRVGVNLSNTEAKGFKGWAARQSGKVLKGAGIAAESTSARRLYEKAAQTRFIPKAPLEATMGSLMRMKMGNLSVQEAHEESINWTNYYRTRKLAKNAKKTEEQLIKNGASKDSKKYKDAKEERERAEAEAKRAQAKIQKSYYTDDMKRAEAQRKTASEDTQRLQEEMRQLTEEMRRRNEQGAQSSAPNPDNQSQQTGQDTSSQNQGPANP